MPLGLCVARIVEVRQKERSLLIEGADCVDGTPVFDVKPYVCQDSVDKDELKVPDWVGEKEEEKRKVVWNEGVREKAVNDVWEEGKNKSLYEEGEGLARLAEEVVCRDIRSVHRQKSHSQEHSVELDVGKFSLLYDNDGLIVTITDVELRDFKKKTDNEE